MIQLPIRAGALFKYCKRKKDLYKTSKETKTLEIITIKEFT